MDNNDKDTLTSFNDIDTIYLQFLMLLKVQRLMLDIVLFSDNNDPWVLQDQRFWFYFQILKYFQQKGSFAINYKKQLHFILQK